MCTYAETSLKDEPCYLELVEDVCFVTDHPPGTVEAGLRVVTAGFSGVMEVKEGLEEEGRRGTVGRPGGEGGIGH